MCSTVVTPDGRWLQSIAELVAEGLPVTEADRAWDAKTIVVSGQVHQVEAGRADDDECLCSVDVEAILDRSGRAWEHDGSGFYDLSGT